jgi:hypothetical protein
MNQWWKTAENTYLASDTVRVLYTEESGSDWRIIADIREVTIDITLNGVYASQADALAAIAKLTQGFDPATLVP